MKKQKFRFRGQPLIDLTTLRIEGERLYLKSTHESYGADIFKEFTSEITRYMFPAPAKKIEETLSFIAASIDEMQQGSDLVLVVLEKEKNEFLGCCGLHLKSTPEAPELGIWIKKSAHGKKYGMEAIRTLTDWAQENIEFDYLIYPVDRANIASRKIPEALGGTIFEEKRVKTMSGGFLDEVVYKILPK